jgi:hypothetical protein
LKDRWYMESRGARRSRSHSIENAAQNAILACFPNHWERRHLTGRDYGIDGIIEIGSLDEMPGEMFSIRAKGTTRLRWRKNGLASVRGIKISTVHYWMKLPMPVFLCVHEASSGNVYFVDVKSYVRRNFGRLRRSRTFAFEVDDAFVLNSEEGIWCLLQLFARESFFQRFAHSLKFLLAHERTLDVYRTEHKSQPPEAESDDRALAIVNSFVSACKAVSGYLRLEWRGPELFDIAKKAGFRDLTRPFRHGVLAWMYDELAPHYGKLVQAGKKMVTEIERQFWRSDDPILVQACYSPEMWALIEAKKREFLRSQRE